jgi:hypothetical protein
MALSNGRGGFNSGPMIFLTPKTKDAEGHAAKPHFTVDRKDANGEFVRDPETVTEVSGDLFRVELKRREYQGDPKIDAVLYLRDGDESYRLPVTLGIAGRDLINRLAGLTESGDFTGLTISYYENRKGYDSFSLEQRGTRVQWKHDYASLPEPFLITDPRNPEKIIKRDYSDLNAVFEGEINAIAVALGQQSAEKPATAPAPVTDGSGEGDQSAEDQTPAPAPARPAAPAPRAPAPAARPAPRPAPAAAAPAPRTTAAPAPAARPAARTTAPAPAARPAPAPAARPAARPAPKAPAPAPAAVSDAPGDSGSEDVPF